MVHEHLEGIEEPRNEGFDLESAIVIGFGAGVERSDVPPGPLIAQKHGFYLDAGTRTAPVVDQGTESRVGSVRVIPIQKALDQMVVRTRPDRPHTVE